MGSGKNAETAVFKRAGIQMDSDVQHRHDLLTQEQIAGAVCMPSHLGKFTFRSAYIMVEYQTIFFIFCYTTFVWLE